VNSESDELISSIAPDAIHCLEQRDFFKKLDDVFSPENDSRNGEVCDQTYRVSKRILEESGFDEQDVAESLAVLRLKGACCDCEVLYNVAEESRLKSRYWTRRANGQTPAKPHSGSE
jgi:hypothetical protein